MRALQAVYEANTKASNSNKVFKIILLLTLLYFWFEIAIKGQKIGILSGTDLIFHEAGHLIFYLLPQFIYILGGTIGQITIPAIVTANFLFRKNYFATSIGVFWLGESVTDVAAYMRDASSLTMPLLGEIHDWAFIFGKLGIIPHAILIGDITKLIGVIILTLSLASAMFFTFSDSK